MGLREASPTEYIGNGLWDTTVSWDLITSCALYLASTQVICLRGQRQSESRASSGRCVCPVTGKFLLVGGRIQDPAVPCLGEGSGPARYTDAGLQRRPHSTSPSLMTLCPVRLHALPRGRERGRFTFHSEPLPSFHGLLRHGSTMPQ